MRFIANEGFYGCGASAITGLAGEYTSVKNPADSDFELSFFFSYNGIGKLYYHFVETKYLQNYAVRDFRNGCRRAAHSGTKMNYEKYFGGHFMEYSEEYIKEIQGEFLAMRHPAPEYYQMGPLKSVIFRGVNKVFDVVNKMANHHKSDVRQTMIYIFQKEIPDYLYNITEEAFISATKRYFEKLFQSVSDGKDIVVVDGFAYRFVFSLMEKLFDDLRIVLVNRDPRDVFLSMKHIWKTGAIPVDHVEVFCKWYRNAREGFLIPETLTLKKVWFEDLIFHYEKTVKELEDFLDLDPKDHRDKFQRFNPDISVKNCQLWKKYTDEDANIKYIKNELSEWIYPYEE